MLAPGATISRKFYCRSFSPDIFYSVWTGKFASKEWNRCKSFLQRLETGTERESLEKCLWIKWQTEITSIIHQSWQALSPAQTSPISFFNAPWETFALGWINVRWEMSGCINCSNYFHGKPSSAQKKNINLSSQGKSFKLFSFFEHKENKQSLALESHFTQRRQLRKAGVGTKLSYFFLCHVFELLMYAHVIIVEHQLLIVKIFNSKSH